MSEERIKELEDAIREHRDQKGDDRCWLDDRKLYRVIGDDADLSLPPKHDFLKSCERYWEQRQSLNDKFALEHPTIGQLNRRIATLTTQRDALLAACQLDEAYRWYSAGGSEVEAENVFLAHGWHSDSDPEKFITGFRERAIALACPTPATQSPTCTGMFEPEKGGE